MTGEPPEHRLKRMKMRAWRRGTREMDLLLGRFADAQLSAMKPAELDRFDHLLAEADVDLNAWFTGQQVAPERYGDLLSKILKHSMGHGQPG